MSMTPQEAAQSLEEAQRSARRSAEAFGYRLASPHLILWGIVWVLGYAGTDLWPRHAGEIWLALIVLGIAAGAIIGRALAARRSANASMHTMRFIALSVILLAFISGTYLILQPVNGEQQGAFVPLLAAAIYAGLGLWMGLRYVILGVLVAALTLGGYFYLHQHFLLWMAFIGGGALILAGFWFRKV